MPEPNYNPGDPGTFMMWFVAFAVIISLLILWQACR
jgi:hypothetical protein